MRLRAKVIVLFIGFLPIACLSQQQDSLINRLDSLKKQTDTTGQHNLVEPAFYDERTRLNARVFTTLLLDDFKQQALSPLDINKKGWKVGASLVAATVAISFIDKPT